MVAACALARRVSSFRFPLRPTISSPSPSSSIPSHVLPRLQRPLRISPSRLPSSFRRESLVLSSMLPAHSAIASARLVSKLTSEAGACIEGRFANYLSPI